MSRRADLPQPNHEGAVAHPECPCSKRHLRAVETRTAVNRGGLRVEIPNPCRKERRGLPADGAAKEGVQGLNVSTLRYRLTLLAQQSSEKIGDAAALTLRKRIGPIGPSADKSAYFQRLGLGDVEGATVNRAVRCVHKKTVKQLAQTCKHYFTLFFTDGKLYQKLGFRAARAAFAANRTAYRNAVEPHAGHAVDLPSQIAITAARPACRASTGSDGK